MTEEKVEEKVEEKTEEEIREEIAAEEFELSPPAKKKVEEEPKEEPEKELETKPDEDPWAGVNPALKQSFDDMSAKVKAFDSMVFRLKQTESRIGAIQNKLSAAEKAAQKPPAPTKEEVAKAAAEDKSWEELKEDFPEWAEAVDARFSRASSGIETTQKELREAMASHIQGEIATLRAEMLANEKTREKTLLSFKYPDWETTIQTPEYKKFIETEPEEIKQLTFSPLAKDAVKVLDRFEKSKTKTNKSPAEIAAERKRRLQESVSAKGTKTMPAKSEADMTEEELRRKIAAETWAD